MPLLSRSTPSGDGLSGPPPGLGATTTVLVVGYPAREAVEVVERLLKSTDLRPIACIVEEGAWEEADRQSRRAQEAGRLRLYRGSATEPGLGLPHTAWRLLDTTGEMYCVASPEALASGHAQEFADECPRLQRLHLVATAAPGRRWASSAAHSVLRLPSRLLSRVREVGAVGIRLTGAVAAGIASMAEVVDFDFDAALSWEELESDLWPGVPQAA